MSWLKIKENLKESAEKLKDAANIALEDVLDNFNPKNNFSVDELKDFIEKNPNASKEDVLDFVNSKESEKLYLKLTKEFDKFKKLSKDAITNSEFIENIEKSIKKLSTDRDIIKMREVLKMTSSINDILVTTKGSISSISHRFLKNIHEKINKN